MLIWVGLQFGLLALAAFRVPLSARWPVPAEQLAMHEMAIGQAIGGALLLPILFRTLTSSAMAIALAPLFLLLAAAMGAYADTERLIWCAGYVGLWLGACALWAGAAAAAAAQRATLYVMAAVLLLSAGGAMLAYLRREFGVPTQAFDWNQVAPLGPASGAVVILEAGPASGMIWVELGLIVFSGLIALPIGRLLARRRRSTAQT
ncbi:MAG TPA: hypothetical protein VK986_14255 [Tepidisphaeraceae bacterium]|nr:hypothetical protein [Tepidisphaeraceae bacterium]